MKIKHTPGPWIICAEEGSYFPEHRIFAESDLKDGRIEAGDWDFFVADVGISCKNHKANARLIAQAPTLLAELKNARAFIQEHHDSFVESCTNLATGLIDDYDDILTAEASQDLLNGIDDAIAKATGGRA